MFKKNTGKINEITLQNYIKEKKVSELNNNMKSFIFFLFPTIKENDVIRAKKFGENYKPDIVIEYNGINKYISLKTGNSNSVHQEHIYSFLCHIESNFGASKEIIKIIKEFHFNDGTLDGSGNTRKSANDYQTLHQENIQKLNVFFDSPNVKEKIIERILISGEYKNIPKIDAIYYGTIDKGYWASSDEILKYLKEIKFYSASPHISKLYYQSLHRNLDKDLYFEFRRYYVQFKWYSIQQDLQLITKKRT